jgi:hypothetical protein
MPNLAQRLILLPGAQSLARTRLAKLELKLATLPVSTRRYSGDAMAAALRHLYLLPYKGCCTSMIS